ncbi:hypothetical protein HAZT_HAZT008110 [Hyalella azteca]|uniref:Dipeptidase n=1 Tax=Hyalella azteca TaxID=294128 RepID=A0A6A0HCR5_HYAAZ|nr:hypothetical protein HAZT_HAZT008110 [Hyalella azteca]
MSQVGGSEGDRLEHHCTVERCLCKKSCTVERCSCKESCTMERCSRVWWRQWCAVACVLLVSGAVVLAIALPLSTQPQPATRAIDRVLLDTPLIDGTPRGLEDVSKYPALLEELLHEGWTEPDVAKVAGGNFLRVMREVEKVSEGSGEGK